MTALDQLEVVTLKIIRGGYDENKSYAATELGEFDAFLFGRVSYETFRAQWANVRGDAFVDRVNGMAKYVVSRSLR